MKKNVFTRLLKYLNKKYIILLIIVFIFIIISTTASIISSTFIKDLIDLYIEPLLLSDNKSFEGLFYALIKLAILYLLGLIASYLYNIIMVTVSQGILKDIRNNLFNKMENLPLRYFDENKYGDIMARFTNDTDALEGMISQGIPNFITSIITIIGILIAMITLSLPITIFILIFTCLLLYITKKTVVSGGKYFKARQEIFAEESAYIEEMIQGSRIIKVFTREEIIKKDFDNINDRLCEANYKSNAYASILMPLISSLGNIEYVLVAIVGSILALKFNLGITVGTIASFLLLVKNFNRPIAQMSSQFNQIAQAVAGAKRVFEMMDEKEEVDSGNIVLVNYKIKNDKIYESKENTNLWAFKIPNKDTYDYVKLEGKIEFKDVDFGYNKELVLKNINFNANIGSKIAIVGKTGSGKTTIANLINRFYEIEKGTILYDGINIKNIKKSSLRKSIGVVLQDTNLFTGTILDNIKYGKLDATNEEVIEASKKANADSFIRMLPNGYDTIIENNGDNLSQGQRQLLSIARTFLANPPVMILDEATSSIDTRTEKLVQEAMDKLMENRTVFVIAHRLSTIKNADDIMVLQDGKIIEHDNHSNLLKQKGEYYKLYKGLVELE